MIEPFNSDSRQEEWIRIAQVGAPHGVRGEVKVFSLSDVPGRFENLKTVFWLGSKKLTQRLTVVSVRPCERFIILQFQEIKDCETAAKLTNGFLVLPKEQRGQLPEGQYFIDDLLGLQVEDINGKKIGKLVEVYQTGSNDVYEIKAFNDKEILLPALKEVVIKIDFAAQKMFVKIPEGYE